MERWKCHFCEAPNTKDNMEIKEGDTRIKDLKHKTEPHQLWKIMRTLKSNN